MGHPVMRGRVGCELLVQWKSTDPPRQRKAGWATHGAGQPSGHSFQTSFYLSVPVKAPTMAEIKIKPIRERNLE